MSSDGAEVVTGRESEVLWGSPAGLMFLRLLPSFFFLNDPAPTEFSTLPLPDALPISDRRPGRARAPGRPVGSRSRRTLGARGGASGPNVRSVDWDPGASPRAAPPRGVGAGRPARDRKSTRLNSSHSQISYAVFCLKKK